MNIHTATLPDGTEVKRTSQNRTYTHLVAIEHQYGQYDYNVKPIVFVPSYIGWVAYSWAGSETLARKAAQSISGKNNVLKVRVVPCTLTTKTVTKMDPRAAEKMKLTRRAHVGNYALIQLQPANLAKLDDWAVKNLVASATRAAHYGNLRLALDETAVS